MLHVLGRHAIAEAARLKGTAEAVYSASAPFHISGKGVGIFTDFLARMQAIIAPPDPSADPLADAEIAAYERLQARFGRP